MYGREIINTVRERSDGSFEWKEGTLYPCLHRLEEAGHVRSQWKMADNGRNRRYYAITPQGGDLLKRKLAEWSASRRRCWPCCRRGNGSGGGCGIECRDRPDVACVGPTQAAGLGDGSGGDLGAWPVQPPASLEVETCVPRTGA